MSYWGPPEDWVRELADSLAAELRQIVLPRLGRPWSRGLAGRAVGGDTTFAVDAEAEAHVQRRLKGFARPVAYYSEDQGLVGSEGADWVFIVDPIDGTRPAIAGLEAACVSVAVARLTHRPAMEDVWYGVILEIKEGGVFRAVRGGGVEILDASGRRREVSISMHSDLSRLFWTIGFRGRPAAELVAVLGGLIDRSSVNGGVFDLGSATYTMTRILTGQLDAYVDVGPRMIERSPWVERRFRQVGNGSVLNNCPYDVAAAALILEEAGCVVTDAAGNSLDKRPLLGSDVAHQLSVVAAANREMHAAILQVVEEGLEHLERTGAG
ncbi:MAG: hypothetical protein GXX83_10825 [Gaiellales bacterium]|nr:hypothetical protein [Gaiellales bacterium]